MRKLVVMVMVGFGDRDGGIGTVPRRVETLILKKSKRTYK